jgi:hypothetical protein
VNVAHGGRTSPTALAQHLLDRDEYDWEALAEEPVQQQYVSRDLFRYALILCEADHHLDRLPRLLTLARRLQQRDPEREGFGNFYWYSHRQEVKDKNAVEFCMEPATIIWLRHRDKLTASSRRHLRALMRYSIKACLRREVRPEYTNIALKNAGNLIRLGESLDRPEVAAEGYRRLRQFSTYTFKYGIAEYVTPTYYVVDMSTLQLIRRYSERQSAQKQATGLLKLLWADAALNWYEPARRLAGATSRTYDYLHHQGALNEYVKHHGWGTLHLQDAEFEDLTTLIGGWQPPAMILAWHRRYPRYVRQRWGAMERDARTHQMHHDITVSTASAHYWAMDVPMTVDLPDANRVRGYFIPDGRNDPYGHNPFDIGSGHHKARHLRPVWTAAQQGGHAIGLCIYDLRRYNRDELETLKSHFVLPRDVDEIWLGQQRMDQAKGSQSQWTRQTVKINQPLVLRAGSAAIGLRVVVARTENGGAAPLALVDEKQSDGAMRLTAAHAAEQRTEPGVFAIQARIGSGLADTSQFNAWRRRFKQQPPVVALSRQALTVKVPAAANPISLRVKRPWEQKRTIELRPKPTRAILELDGKPVGRTLLGDAPIFNKLRRERSHGKAAN